MENCTLNQPKLNIRRYDLVFSIFALVFATLVCYARGIFHPPVVDLTSDAANIASFAAALDHPELFAGDSALADRGVAEVYVAFHVDATRLLKPHIGNYGTAFAALLWPHIFLYMIAFYILGLAFLRHRGWATALTLANLVLVKGPRDTAWGYFKDPLPRMSHSIVFAVLIALIWVLRRKPFWWWTVCLAAGLALYVHPVSTPAMGAMLFGAICALMPREYSVKEKLGILLSCAVAFSAPLIPFSLTFLRHTPASVVEGDPSLTQIASILEERFTGHYLLPSRTVFEYITSVPALPIIAVGLFGLVFCLRSREQETLQAGKFFVGLFLGLIFASVFVPIFFEIAFPGISFAMFKGELPRPLRYIVPLCYMASLLALKSFISESTPQRARLLLVSTAALAVCLFAFAIGPRAQRALSTLVEGQKKVEEVRTLVAAVSTMVPPRETIAAVMEDPLVLRYAALRPLAFARKDVPSTVDLDRALQWQRNHRELQRLLKTEDTKRRVDGSINWARNLKSKYLVIELPREGERLVAQNEEILFQNSRFILLSL